MSVQILETGDQIILQVGARLTASIVPELKTCWRQASAMRPARKVSIDLRQVTCIDRAGKYLLQLLKSKGVQPASGAPVWRGDPNDLQAALEQATDLHWLAFLLTGRRDLSIDIAVATVFSEEEPNQYFSTWMLGWSRRIVLAKALEAIRDELAESARRTELASVINWDAAPEGWSLAPDTTKADIEKALFGIDVFPRAAILLLIFEGVPIADAASLLNADAALVRKAQAIGIRELTRNLAQQNRASGDAASRNTNSQLLHA